MKVAHLSDIHFYVPYYGIGQFFSRKCIGNLNAFINRRNFFITDHLDKLIQSFKEKQVDTVIISGDFTTTAREVEFEKSKQFVEQIKDAGLTVFIISGNHDVYTKRAYREKFFQKYLLGNDKVDERVVHVENIQEGWDLLLLDTTMLNKPFHANGDFTKQIELKLKKHLHPEKNVVVANHFPFTDDKKGHALIRGDKLKSILLDHPKNVVYLHGHTHKTDFDKKDNLYILNSSQVTVHDKFCYQTISIGDKINVEKVCYV